MNRDQAIIGAHLDRAQHDTEFAMQQACHPLRGEIARACFRDVADLLGQVEQRYQDALTEMDEHDQGVMQVVRTLRVVPITQGPPLGDVEHLVGGGA